MDFLPKALGYTWTLKFWSRRVKNILRQVLESLRSIFSENKLGTFFFPKKILLFIFCVDGFKMVKKCKKLVFLWWCFVKWNNSSMLLESSCSEVENQKDEIHLPRERFSFSEIWTVQPRSDSCLAAAVGQGWTVRPRLDSPDRGKEQSSRGKGRGRDLFYSRIYLFHALQIHFFYLSNVMTPTKSLWNNEFGYLKTFRTHASISKY